MSVPVIQFTAPQIDFDSILHTVKSWEGVISVATIPNAKNGVDGIVQLESAEARERALTSLQQIKNVSVVGVKSQPSANGGVAATSQPKKQRGKANHVSDFFKFDNYDEQKNSDRRNPQNNHADPSNPLPAPASDAPPSVEQGRGRGRGRGAGRGNTHRGRGRGNTPPFVPIPMIQGYVAVLDNVPFNTTNEQIAKCFVGAGQIFDINRYELMAMVYFDSQEAVQRAIVLLNGKKIKENVITVSSGGVVKVPLPYIHAQQQGFFFQQ